VPEYKSYNQFSSNPEVRKSSIYMREQQKSKTFKHGAEGPHRKAQDRLALILVNEGWTVYPDSPLAVRWDLTSHNGIVLHGCPYNLPYYHEFDIYATMKHRDLGLTSELIVEIDGSFHDSKVQQGKDKIAEEYAKFFLPDAWFKRIGIELLIDRRWRMSNADIIQHLFA
jgi:hypothetical protein